MHRRMLAAALAVIIGLVALAGLPAPEAKAAPPTPDFGPAIEALAALDQVQSCPAPSERQAKPGVVAFAALLDAAYGHHTGQIANNCSGEKGEHWAGRALDYFLDARSPTDLHIADDIFGWLFAPDRYGNQYAMARRLGVMYIIWNRHIWGSYRAAEGWRNYAGTDPHTNHIHFSFSVAGALQQTSYWTHGTPANGPRVALVANVSPCGSLTIKTSYWGDWAQHMACGQAKAVAVSPDGQTIAVVRPDNTLVAKQGLWGQWAAHTQPGETAAIALANL
jgi:hypothetical protein